MVRFNRKKLFYGVLLIVLVLALISGGVLLRDHFRPKAVAAEEIPLVQTQVIQIGGSSQEDSYSGDVVGRYEIPVAFQVSGKLAVSNVNEGSAVQPGDLAHQFIESAAGTEIRNDIHGDSERPRIPATGGGNSSDGPYIRREIRPLYGLFRATGRT